jgi:hypothetical protein
MNLLEILWNGIWGAALGYGMFAWGRRYERKQSGEAHIQHDRKEPQLIDPFTKPK